MVDLSACVQALAFAPRFLKHAEATIRRQQLTLFKLIGWNRVQDTTTLTSDRAARQASTCTCND